METEVEVNTTLGENQSEWPEVAIIVLNWNNYEDTTECLTKTAQLDYPNFRVVVVDNGSTDGSGQRLFREFQWCEYVFNKENLGFAAGINEGIKKSLETGADHILLLNNDAYPKNQFLKEMVRAMHQKEKVGLVGGLMYNTSDELEWAGADINKYTMTSNQYNEPKDQKESYSTDWVNGGAMLINGAFLNETGHLDDSYFFGMEDVEISLRARLGGWKVIVEPNAKIYHKVGSTAGNGNAFRYYHSTRNRLSVINDWLDGIEFYTSLAFFILTRFIRLFQWIILNDNPIKKSRAIMSGAFDYWKKRPPRKPGTFD